MMSGCLAFAFRFSNPSGAKGPFFCHKLPLLCLLSGNWRTSFSRIGLNGEASSSPWISPTSMDGEKCRADFCGTCVWLTAPSHPKAQHTEPTEQQKRFPDCNVNHMVLI